MVDSELDLITLCINRPITISILSPLPFAGHDDIVFN